MKWSEIFCSSVGKKIIMAATGLFLILFLIVHVGLNACIWANDGGEMFNHGAHFMGNNWVPRILEIGLFLGLILHMIQGIVLELTNRTKRGVSYKKTLGSKGSTWYSRSMGLLGTIILLFLIMHLIHFWIPNRSNQGWLLGEEINLYQQMQTVFSVGWVVVLYVVACISLAYHLAHGFQSAFRTFGVYNMRWHKIIVFCGWCYAIIVPLVFAMMPISFYFGWIC